MMNEIAVNCPYCENEIDNNIEQCPFCKEFFKEPYLPNIKLTSIGQFIVFNILSYGLYSVLWILLNKNAFINLADNKKDINKLNTLIVLLILLYVFFPLLFWLIPLLGKVLQLFISYRMLRIIQKLAMKKYSTDIRHSEIGWLFFDILYVVYYIDTFKEKVYNPNLRFHMNTNGWVKYTLIFFITLAVLTTVAYIYSLFIN